MTARYPIAYIRRSSADATDPGDISREAQEAAVRELAHRDGHNGDLRIVVDWDRSADEAKESKRTAFVAMLAAIERGEVSAVYAASLDRLYRSLRTFVTLTDAAKAHDVRIVTLREGVLGGDGSPMARAFGEITAVFSALELNTTKARAAGAMAVRRGRGDHIGRCGYGYQLVRTDAGAIVTAPDPTVSLGPIIEAVREAGTILGGAKLLRARGIPSPDGKPLWGNTTLRRIIEREAPELIPAVGPTGRRQPSGASAFAQLLVCHCGHVMTPEPARKGYRCRMGRLVGSDRHGLGWISEAKLRPALVAEAAHLAIPGDAVESPATDTAQRAALEAKRLRVLDMYADGLIDKTDRAVRLGTIATALERLGTAQVLRVLPPDPIDWNGSPRAVNGILRALWERVELGPDMTPTRYVWRVPEWRADDIA